jgi:hypothetical protein
MFEQSGAVIGLEVKFIAEAWPKNRLQMLWPYVGFGGGVRIDQLDLVLGEHGRCRDRQADRNRGSVACESFEHIAHGYLPFRASSSSDLQTPSFPTADLPRVGMLGPHHRGSSCW